VTEEPVTTWDGNTFSQQNPYGASVVVFRRFQAGLELLMLHRCHLGVDNGPWAWTPLSGARRPGEPIGECAARELFEETGLELPIVPTCLGTDEWFIYVAEAPGECIITLDAEHDRFEWMLSSQALNRCQPEVPHTLLRRVAADYLSAAELES
jgi:8-oxo-dGTP pyrophosphatase MutT (NUDIX family)